MGNKAFVQVTGGSNHTGVNLVIIRGNASRDVPEREFTQEADAIYRVLENGLPGRTLDLLLKRMLSEYPAVEPEIETAVDAIVDHIDHVDSFDTII